ncbi:MAG: hypothetical protein Q9222_005730 [Ikaeria aurantiellina]
MRTVSVSALLALGLAVQQAAATGWTDAHIFKTPSNTDNECTDKQGKGLPFNDHATGDLGNYGDLQWQNVKCTDGLTKRTFGDSKDSKGSKDKDFAGGKCASGSASKDVKTSPKFSCGAAQKGMSINEVHLSASEQTDIEIHYGYENGDVCKQYDSCGPSGKKITNTNCGEAKSVTVKLPDTDTKSNCDVGIHSINFKCGPPASSKPPVPSSTPIQSSSAETSPTFTKPQETKPYPIPSGNTTTPLAPSVPATTTPESTSISSTYTQTGEVPTTSTTALETSTTPVDTTTPLSTAPVETTPTTSTTPKSPETTSAPGTTVPVVTTEVYVDCLRPSDISTNIHQNPNNRDYLSSHKHNHQWKHYFRGDYLDNLDRLHHKYFHSVHAMRPTSGHNLDDHQYSGSSRDHHSHSNLELDRKLARDYERTGALTTVSTITSTSTSTVCTQCIPPPPASGTPAPPPETTSLAPPPPPETTALAPPPPPETTSLVPPPPVETTPAPPPSSTGNSPVGETSQPAAVPSSAAPLPPAPCPNVLPSCMQTFINSTACKDNSDYNCYCQNADFTKAVQSCVSAWGADNNIIQAALSFLAGICAPHVSNNPGIITNVPKTITLVPTPAAPAPTSSAPPVAGTSGAPVIPPASPAPETPAPGVTSAPVIAGTFNNSPAGATAAPPVVQNPVTTLSLSQTVSYACPVSQAADGQPQAPMSSTSCASLLTTQVIVPQVGFETAPATPGATGGGSPNVVLAAGSPAPAPANPTPTAGPGANSPVGAGANTFATVVGSASAVGSTVPGSTNPLPFTGAASNVKVTGFGALVGVVVGMMVLL